MNDRDGNPIVIGGVYVVAGEALSEFGADRVALDTKRAVLVDDTVSGAAPTVSQVSTDLVPLSSLGGGSGHDPVTVTDSSSVNLTLTGQDVTAAAIFGTSSGTVAEGNHTHAQLHDAVTVVDSSSIDLTLTGQQISAAAIFGTGSGTVCQGNDARLSDARAPTSHTHAAIDITSGLAAIATSGSATDLGSGTVPTARLSGIGTGQLGGDITTAGKALLDDADNTAQRTTLGLGTAATRNVGAGGSDLVDVTTLVATFAGLSHTHDGVVTPKLTQANTHESPDTDSATSALHHTLGTGANQAAAGNHTHASTDIVSVTTDRLIGRDTAGTGAAEQLTVGGNLEFTGSGGIQRSALTGDVTASAGSGSTTIANDAVTDAKLRNSAALTVIGRSANSTGDPADIAASADGNVLRRSGTTLGFGTVATAGIADDAISNAKLRNSSALSVIGRSANSTGDPADIATSADGDVLRRSGTTLGFGTIVTAAIGTVTSDRLIGRDTASTGAAEQLTVGGNLEFTGSGGIQRGALTGAVTASAGSGTTAFGSFKANSILMNMTNASGVPTAVDGTDAAANMWAFLGGSYLLPAWNLADAKLGSIAI